MRPHVFHERPIDSALKPYPSVCGHVDIEKRLLCVQRRDHPDHVEADAMDALERRMEGRPSD